MSVIPGENEMIGALMASDAEARLRGLCAVCGGTASNVICPEAPPDMRFCTPCHTEFHRRRQLGEGGLK